MNEDSVESLEKRSRSIWLEKTPENELQWPFKLYTITSYYRHRTLTLIEFGHGLDQSDFRAVLQIICIP